MDRNIDIANRTCRVNIYKKKRLDFSNNPNKVRGCSYVYTAKKGEIVYIGSSKEVANDLECSVNSFNVAWNTRKEYKGFKLTRKKKE